MRGGGSLAACGPLDSPPWKLYPGWRIHPTSASPLPYVLWYVPFFSSVMQEGKRWKAAILRSLSFLSFCLSRPQS